MPLALLPRSGCTASTTGVVTSDVGVPSIASGFAVASSADQMVDCGIHAAGRSPIDAASQVPVRLSRVTLESPARTCTLMQWSRMTGLVRVNAAATVFSASTMSGSATMGTGSSPSTHERAALVPSSSDLPAKCCQATTMAITIITAMMPNSRPRLMPRR